MHKKFVHQEASTSAVAAQQQISGHLTESLKLFGIIRQTSLNIK